MIGEGNVPVRSRENRSWGYEIAKGPPNLQRVIASGEGGKPIPVTLPPGEVGTLRVTVERRMSTDFQMRMNVRAWVSEPVRFSISEDTKDRAKVLFRALNRLIHMKASKFKGSNNGAQNGQAWPQKGNEEGSVPSQRQG